MAIDRGVGQRRAKLEQRYNTDIKCDHPRPVSTDSLRSIGCILIIVFLCSLTPVHLHQQVGRARDSLPAANISQRRPTDQNGLSAPVESRLKTSGATNNSTNRTTPVSSRTLNSINRRSQLPLANVSEKEPTTRIATLDDLSHRLDQTRENVSLEMDDHRVPFWNIAHMINSIEQVDLALGTFNHSNQKPVETSAGSNGIETDVSFDANGRPTHAYHGVPCDCGRHCFHQEDLVKFVQYLARITNPPSSSRLFVVLFDLKLKDLKEPRQKETAGSHLAELLHKFLYAPYQAAASYHSRHGLVQPPLRVVVSINHASDILVVKSFLSYMHNNRLSFMSQQVGFDVGMNDNLTEISAAWDELRGATFNIWQGDGLTNCVNIVRGVERLKQAISMRNDQGHFRKVYFWTADIMYHIRSVLRLGLDAMLTNKPQRVNQILNEPEFKSKYRLATAYDDTFQQFHIRPSSWNLSRPTVGEIVETIHNIRETSSNFIKTLPDGLSAAINRLTQITEVNTINIMSKSIFAFVAILALVGLVAATFDKKFEKEEKFDKFDKFDKFEKKHHHPHYSYPSYGYSQPYYQSSYGQGYGDSYGSGSSYGYGGHGYGNGYGSEHGSYYGHGNDYY